MSTVVALAAVSSCDSCTFGLGNPSAAPPLPPVPPIPGCPPNSRVVCSPGMNSGRQSASRTEAVPTRRPAAASGRVSGA